MEAFSALLALRAGNSPVTAEFPAQRPVMQGFDAFFDLVLNKQLSKQSRLHCAHCCINVMPLWPSDAISRGWNEHWYSEARVCLGVKLSGYSEAKHTKHRSTLGKPGHTVSKCIFTHIHGLHQFSKYSHFNRNTFWSWCNGSHLCNPCSSERPRWMCVGDIKEFV